MKTMPAQLDEDRTGKSADSKALEYSSVQKALGILLSFIPDNKPVGNAELSASLGLNKSTVSRLTHVLAHYGLLQQDEKTQKYELGRTVAQLGMAVEVSQHERMAQIGQPYVDYLRNAVNESVCLDVLVPTGQVRVVCGAVGPPPLSITFPESLPMHVSAGGKAILAFSDPAFTEHMLNGSFARITGNTITNAGVFRAQLEDVRRDGVAFDRGEANTGVHTVSVAVMNHMKKPVAALTLCVPANRAEKITDPANIALLRKAASMLSSQLFYEAPKR